MKPSRSIKHVVVESEADFDHAVNKNGVVVKFASQAEENSYETLSKEIIGKLDELLIATYGKQNDGVLFHHNWDDWGTRSRFIWLTPSSLSWNLIDRFRELLVGDLVDWRINTHVLSTMTGKDSREIGGLNVYRDWLLIQRAVYELLAESKPGVTS